MHVTRERRRPTGVRTGLLRTHRSRRVRLAAAGTTALVLTGGGLAYGSTSAFGRHQVGTTYPDGTQVASNQVLGPLGDRTFFDQGKFMGSTPSPDGTRLAASVSTWGTADHIALAVVDLDTSQIVQTVGTTAAADLRISHGQVGQEGPTYSPDGRTLWLPQTTGLTRFAVAPDGTLSDPTFVSVPERDGHAPLPGKSAYSADGSTLYVPVNGQNRVVALDPATGAVRQSWDVGTAPREVAVVGDTLYVSNEGGRPARPGDTTLNSYGTQVPADPHLGTASTGTVSVIDPSKSSDAVSSVDVGLHPTSLSVHGDALFVTNTFDDSVSVLDTRRNEVVQTITTRPWPTSKVGYAPQDVTVTDDGHLLVALGRANAVAVYRYHGRPQEPVDYVGLLPTDYYPSDVTTVGDDVLVTNRRGMGSLGPKVTIDKGPGTSPATGHGTHATTGSLTRFRLPADPRIDRYTREVFRQNGWGRADARAAAAESRGRTPAAQPVPHRVGDPSTIKHVFLIVNENRTYDQVLGDVPEGNGDPSKAQFGEKVTPNKHALAKQFGLYDNFYDIGTNSAEGHNWVMQGDNPEYTESEAGGYVRSYDTEDDALGHQRSGFLWTAAQDAGKTARNFGEFMQFEHKPAGATWQDYYCAATRVEDGGDPSALTDPAIKQDTESPIPSLNEISNHDYPKFDTNIPDVYRSQIWRQDFARNGPANLNTFWLSSDHTGGAPDPEAQVADGDRAVGQIVDEISHSRYWKDSAIFVVEDDSQNGVDHVDGHRAPVEVISPWAKRGVVDHTYYSQITMVRTIEQILGAQPLNQKVAAATPMYGAFTRKPDFTRYEVQQNRVPLTEGLSEPPACGLDTLGKTGAAARKVTSAAKRKAHVPPGQAKTKARWEAWRQKQRFTGDSAVPDQANPEQMNRWTWYQTHTWQEPYPGDEKIYAPSEVPGGYIPPAESDG